MNFKRSISTFLALATLSTSILSAFDIDIDNSDFSAETISEPEGGGAFHVGAYIDAIQGAEIRNGFYKGDKIHFAEASGEIGMVFYHCPAYAEGAAVAISYTYTQIKWDENPWFNQDHFNTVSLVFSGFSNRLCRWMWKSQVAINMDANQWDLEDYSTYDILLWGRYEYRKDIGVHIGFLAQTGMQMDRVYPILGADWQVSKRWKLNLVYPVNISLDYLVTDNWSFALAGRAFNSRHRVSPRESHPRYVVRYENTGAEFAVKYSQSQLTANVHAGTTLGGRYRIADKNNNHPHTYKLDPSLYVGAEVNMRF